MAYKKTTIELTGKVGRVGWVHIVKDSHESEGSEEIFQDIGH